MGRRVQKVVETYDGSSWSTNAVAEFVWDLSAVPTGQAGGWLLIGELDGMDSDALTRTYTWGLDLSGTFQGAGGIRLRSGSYGGHVGGLLMVDAAAGDGFCGYYAVIPSTGRETGLRAPDGSPAGGGIGQVLDAEDLSTEAHYEYDPYGREIVATGTYADDNPWRFSTKYLDVLDPNDDDASLLYYGFRSYAPRLGRWMSRDPIAEVGAGQVWGAHGSGSEAGGIKDAAARRSQPGSLVAGSSGLRRAYIYVDNVPIGALDYLGLFGIPGGKVRACTIVIFVGHKTAHRWAKIKYEDRSCSASTLVACNTSGLLAAGGGYPNPVPGYVGTEKPIIWHGRDDETGFEITPGDDEEGRAYYGAMGHLAWWQDEVEKASTAAKDYARVLCKRCACRGKCKSIQVEYRKTGGGMGLAPPPDMIHYKRGPTLGFGIVCSASTGP